MTLMPNELFSDSNDDIKKSDFMFVDRLLGREREREF